MVLTVRQTRARDRMRARLSTARHERLAGRGMVRGWSTCGLSCGGPIGNALRRIDADRAQERRNNESREAARYSWRVNSLLRGC